MKLIKQIQLYFQEGSSDKVYEIDLCEVGPGRCVVNYRFGRRGSRLKEGSQTAAPVSLAEAQKVFDSLASSKLKKGYREGGPGASDRPAASPAARASAKPTADAAIAEKRQQAVLHRLQLGPLAKGWPLERAIFRAGELRLRAAAPALLRLLGSASGNGPLRDYCIAWALGRLGEQSAVEPLVRLWRASGTPDSVRRMAVEALRLLSDSETRAEMGKDLSSELPSELRKPVEDGNPEALVAALHSYLAVAAPAKSPPASKSASSDDDDDDQDDEDDDSDSAGESEASVDPERFEVLETLYLIDNEKVRPALLQFLRNAPLRPPYFQRLRHIFKAAEYRRDGEVFGLLAYRFEKEKAYYKIRYRGSRWVSLQGGRHMSLERKDVRAELAHAESKIAYSQRTRHYFRRRVWRTLRRLGELSDPDYVKMAVGVLLPFSDGDAVEVRRRGRNHWDRFAPYFAWNYILYGKSPRYRPPVNAVAWRCRSSYKPGDPEPAVREESFPQLWTDRPQGLLHLLEESGCQPVHHFAVKALRPCAAFLAALDSDAVIMLLGRPYEATARLGCELARLRYSPAAPDHALVLAMASCAHADGRATALRWIDEARAHFLGDSELVLALCLNQHADTRAFALRLLRSAGELLSEPIAWALIVRMVAHLMSLGAAEVEQARDVAAILLSSLGPALRRVGVRVLLDLLRHPLAEVQELGANLLLQHETPPQELPAAELEELLQALLGSTFPSVRALGMRLLSELPERLLQKQHELLRTLCMHPLADLRNAVRPLMKRLSNGHAAFAEHMVFLLVQALQHPDGGKDQEDVHVHLLRLLREDLAVGLPAIAREDALRLCQAKSQLAQELGGQLLKLHPDWADHISTAEIVRLGGAEVREVREASFMLFGLALPRLRASAAELSAAVRMLETKWEDSREFATRTFRESFSEREFTPDILVGICDSVRPEVQAFGRELITRFFAEENGPEYLLKLSEHPSTDLQRFATNYLERFAAGDLGRLRTLLPYFVSVLSRVNQGRLAKSRVYALLLQEARGSEAAARLAAEVLERVSATLAIGDRARALEAMVEIRRLYPGIPLPIIIRSPEVRGAV
jgi:hypothetical protein